MKRLKNKRIESADWAFLILLFLLLGERLLVFRELGYDYMIPADDMAYVEAGYYFIQTGVISVWGPHPTAMIMPGMPVVTGLMSLLFPLEAELIIALKMLWIVMGVMTAAVVYRSVSVFASKWAGLYAAAHFLIPNMAWMNHLILTETPYFLFFTLTVYYTLCMGKENRKSFFTGYIISYMCALMFRANIIYMPIFTAGYLLLKNKDGKLLLRRGIVLSTVLLLFVVPWTVRNYIKFDAFIPLTYGAGEPLLLGTYEGEGYPEDEDLDYKSNVRDVMYARYARYYKDEAEPWEGEIDSYTEKYDPDGLVKNLDHAQYLYMQECRLKAQYRMRVWWEENPLSFLRSFLEIKPHLMLNWVWAWECVLGVPYEALHRLSQLNCVFCAGTIMLSAALKKYRKEILFLTVFFIVSVYIYALAFVTDRYQSALLPIRYIMSGFGAELLAVGFHKWKERLRKDIV